MAVPIIVTTVDVFRMGAGAAEVRIEDADRVTLILSAPGAESMTFKFTGEQAKRIGDGLMTAAIRLSIRDV